MPGTKNRLLLIIGPGILVAATGVGAGDLATGAFTGIKLGVAVLWAVVIGAGLKFLLNEGLARWQLATDSTLLEGCVAHLGRTFSWVFFFYLLAWSYLVGLALISACGVAAHAILPCSSLLHACGVTDRAVLQRFAPQTDKIIYGIVHSAIALVLVRWGGYRLFQKVMSVCIAVMFVVVVTTAVALKPAWSQVATGLVWPTIPQLGGEGLPWTIALMGGIGGTLTVLCYGYWIREEGRHGPEALKVCRIDLATGYAMTALFGIAMVMIGSTTDVELHGRGARLIVNLAEQLHATLGPVAMWAFLIGAWGAIFSSLLGVWQSVPYLFADFWGLMQKHHHAGVKQAVDTRSRPYRLYLWALAVVPVSGLWLSFEQAQKVYAIVGALCIPILALVLLILNGQSRLVGRRYRNSLPVSLLLAGALAFFALAGWFQIRSKFFKRQSEPAPRVEQTNTGNSLPASPHQLR